MKFPSLLVFKILHYRLGMIVSAIGWGYVSDTKGRKNLLVFGFLVDFVCVLCGAMSQSRIQLMIAKFFGGFV